MLKLLNTLSGRLQEVVPGLRGQVRMYTCGPTVYRDAHIGNLRSYLMADWIRRVLQAQSTAVIHVKNITDVGHMRQERLEQGEDKVIAAARAEGKTPRQIAELYTDRFLRDESKLNIAPAEHLPRASDHVEEVISIVQRLIDKRHAYEVGGNVYFAVDSFPEYGKLSGNVQDALLREAVRIEGDPLKLDPRDFTLWKAAEAGRELRWPSPWGEGFPGWHIECSAMSIKYLGERFEIHTGGVDNIFPHHEGEIAQSEGYTGAPVVDLWVHGQHLLADGVKMAKSNGNSFILSDLETRGIEPLAFRYLCLTARYTNRLNFTFSSLKAAQRGLLRLRNRAWTWATYPGPTRADGSAREEWMSRFLERVNDNLDMPGALALAWELARSDMPDAVKLEVLREFDDVLGLGLAGASALYRVPEHVRRLVERRSRLRAEGRYPEADAVRDDLGREGYVVEDGADGTRVRPKTEWEKRQEAWASVSSSAEVPSLLGKPDEVEFSLCIAACNYLEDVKRCVSSALHWAGERPIEVVALDNGSTDGTGDWLEQAAARDPRLSVLHTDHVLGEGSAWNMVVKQSRGRTVVLLDTSTEVVGDIFTPLGHLLSDDTVGVAGPFGLRTTDLRHFRQVDGEGGDVDAMQAYCFAFRRSTLREVGLVRESFRFYRNLDLDFSFHFKDKGRRVVADPTLPVRRHRHRKWSELPKAQREELSRRNYRRFLDKWGHRTDLLVANRGDH